jgi:hypothetical protein
MGKLSRARSVPKDRFFDVTKDRSKLVSRRPFDSMTSANAEKHEKNEVSPQEMAFFPWNSAISWVAKFR